MLVTRLDHLVLTVADIEASCTFYERTLGMERRGFDDGRVALHFGNQKINLHRAGAEFAPAAARPTPGSADICLITAASLDTIRTHLDRQGVAIIEGPVPRTGAEGPMRSIYFRDPDGNLVEVSEYT